MLDISISNRSAVPASTGFARRVWRVLGWPARVMEARRTLAQLASFTDHELRDIGLSRQDLADCTALPRDADPTERLAQARAARAWYSHSRRAEAA